MNKITDFKNNQIDFLDERFYASADLEGKYYPGSTTILGLWKKPGLDLWKKQVGMQADIIMQKAADEGTNVHQMIQNFLLGNSVSLHDSNGSEKFNKTEWVTFNKFLEFYERYRPKTLAVEKIIVSDKLMYGGQLDWICEINGETWLIDHKTSNSIYEDHYFQLISYLDLADQFDIKIDRVGILHLKALTKTDKDDPMQGKGWQVQELKLHKMGWAESRFNWCKNGWMMQNVKVKEDKKLTSWETGKEYRPEDLIFPMPKNLKYPIEVNIKDYEEVKTEAN